MTGGFGFIGKHVIRAIRDLDESHTLTVFSGPQTAETNANFAKEYDLKVITGDVRDAKGVMEAFASEPPNVALHLAALTGVEKCHRDPSLAFSVNVYGSYNVIMGSATAGAKLVFISSREVYGEGALPRASEDSPLAPNNLYGMTKELGERMVKWGHLKFGLRYSVLRLTNVYGPEGGSYNIQAMIRSAFQDGEIPLRGGAQLMNLVYVDDVATAIVRCLTDSRTTNETFNIGSDQDLPVLEIVDELISELEMPVVIRRRPMRKGETLNFHPDLAKMKEYFDGLPKTQLKEGLRKTIAWYKAQIKDASQDDR